MSVGNTAATSTGNWISEPASAGGEGRLLSRREKRRREHQPRFHRRGTGDRRRSRSNIWEAEVTHWSADRMARGQQKIQSQAKAAEKSAKIKKQQGHSANDQKKAAQKALVHVCSVCKAQMPDPKTYKQHFENKHPKNELPDDLKNI